MSPAPSLDSRAAHEGAAAHDEVVAPAAEPRRPLGDIVLAVDIGSTKMSVGVVTLQGELIDRDRVEVDSHLAGDALFATLNDLLQSQLERARDHHHMRPVAVGVGSSGPISFGAETVSPINILSWRNFPLRERLAEATSLPVFGDLDAKALALAEGWLGAAQGKESFLAMVVGTGVGGGIVLNGQLLDGASGNAGHVGHIIVEPNGRRCPCGSRGCLEAEASGAAIEAITGRPPTEPTYEIMQRTGRLVGRAAASVCNVLDLDLVVVGGSVALGFGATFFNSAQETLDEHAKLAFARGARITPVRLGDRGPLIGAGAVAVRGIHRSRRAASAQRAMRSA
ncbi:MAG: ROK family protein [Actinomycetota bacterium]|nr:ROK family protein [Actinomycetota bacterium]